MINAIRLDLIAISVAVFALNSTDFGKLYNYIVNTFALLILAWAVFEAYQGWVSARLDYKDEREWLHHRFDGSIAHRVRISVRYAALKNAKMYLQNICSVDSLMNLGESRNFGIKRQIAVPGVIGGYKDHFRPVNILIEDYFIICETRKSGDCVLYVEDGLPSFENFRRNVPKGDYKLTVVVEADNLKIPLRASINMFIGDEGKCTLEIIRRSQVSSVLRLGFTLASLPVRGFRKIQSAVTHALRRLNRVRIKIGK